MYFTPGSEIELVRDAALKILVIPLVKPSNNVWSYLTQSKIPASHFQFGYSIIYTNKSHTELVDQVDINKNYPA